jgi:uncharacterized protein YecE (DUF72 family)
MGSIRIGTSGWHYMHWRGNFYPKEMAPAHFLEEYIRHFDTVELNGTFYNLPAPATVRDWYRSTPAHFLFSFKASRFLTHNKKLKDPREPLRRVLRCAEGLKEKLGPILFQLPPHWRLNLERLQAFLKILPKDFEYVFEFREPSWYIEPVYEALRGVKAGLCMYSMAGQATPVVFTSRLVYLRFHGAEGKYNGNYPTPQLRAWAASIKRWSRGRRVLAYFNNDPQGHAPKNAQELKDLLM